jgi:hypothetical protein
MSALWAILFHQRQVRSAKRPLLIADITWITGTLLRHPQRTAGMYLHCTDNFRKKFMTGFKAILRARAAA